MSGLIVGLVVFVLVFVVVGIAKSASAKGTATRPDFEASEGAEKRVKEFRLNAAEAEIASSAQIPSRRAEMGNSRSAPREPRKLQPRTEPRNMVPRIGLSSNLRAEAPHSHPTEPDADYRVERVDVAGSLGTDVSEGCADTYFLRLIKLGKEDAERPEPRYELIKTVVFGELLAHPKFKKQ